jgi:hypothetical protein
MFIHALDDQRPHLQNLIFKTLVFEHLIFQNLIFKISSSKISSSKSPKSHLQNLIFKSSSSKAHLQKLIFKSSSSKAHLQSSCCQHTTGMQIFSSSCSNTMLSPIVSMFEGKVHWPGLCSEWKMMLPKCSSSGGADPESGPRTALSISIFRQEGKWQRMSEGSPGRARAQRVAATNA